MTAELQVQENIDLSAYNTMRLAVCARYFIRAQTLEHIQQAVSFAKERQLPLCILGGGSNVIFQQDFSGVVLHIANTGISVISEADDSILLGVGAGENWDAFLQVCLARKWYGLENLAIIPGTVGAAPIQNIGAYGQEVADCIHAVNAFEVSTGEMVKIPAKECGFAYRDSVFKQQSGRYVVTSVELALQKNFVANVNYQALQQQLPEKISAEDVRAAVIAVRQSKLPDPAKIANTGSFFKNPVITKAELTTLKNTYPNIPNYPQECGGYKVAAGWLIEQAGFKGKALGPVAMYEKQALVLVNNGAAKSADVIALASAVRQKVQQQFSVLLEQEPVLI